MRRLPATTSAPMKSTCPPGRVVYTQMLNARGGIESDLTVTRLSETAFLLVVPGATLQRDIAGCAPIWATGSSRSPT
jgi:glycine cleavage system aminomethyltransferase T